LEAFDLTLLIIILLCFVFITPPIISTSKKVTPNWLLLVLFVSAIILAILMTLKIKGAI
jgi:Flp pilus assembly protein protease CpaA